MKALTVLPPSFVIQKTEQNKQRIMAHPTCCLSSRREYTFPEFNTMYHLPNQEYWVGNGNTLDVLSDATQCQTYFGVPLEVRDSAENPVTIQITIADEPFTFQAR